MTPTHKKSTKQNKCLKLTKEGKNRVMSKYRGQKLLMVMSIQDSEGKSVEIARSNIMEAEKVLTLGEGGTRCYLDLPDLSIYNPNARISVDLYQLEPKVIEQ